MRRKELGIDPPFEIKNPAPVSYDPLTATAEENRLREELEHLEGAEAASELLADIADEQSDTGEHESVHDEGYDDPADFPVFTPVEVFADGKWQEGEGAYVAAECAVSTARCKTGVCSLRLTRGFGPVEMAHRRESTAPIFWFPTLLPKD